MHALDAQAAALASAISARKHAVISAAAHRLRGLGGMVRATELKQAAQHLEDLARGGAADYEEAWQHMRHACEVLKQKLS
ncbi:MAG TPA: Hpt domain-containing protein [Opitutus sp.]|nr:Hpt domain-containing protein [Opitutus sp.]